MPCKLCKAQLNGAQADILLSELFNIGGVYVCDMCRVSKGPEVYRELAAMGVITPEQAEQTIKVAEESDF